jgi:murein DD-endopeptidase MepM/ murein hydrolase activator NlpD
VRSGARLAALLSVLLTFLASLAAPLAAEAPRRPQRYASPPTSHRVKSGETLARIAAHHHVTVASLVSVNQLNGPEARLRAGQRLAIPRSGAPVARVRRNVAVRTVAVASAQRASSPPRTLVLSLPDFSGLLPLFVWPVDGQISSKFGRRKRGWHQGIDITADHGTPVTASAGGVVLGSSFEGRYGRVVKIEHPNGFVTVYAHNSENLVEIGERVMVGQPIAAVGRTGRATASHVHFEIRQAGLAYNPLYMLPFPPRPTLTEETSEEDHDDADE